MHKGTLHLTRLNKFEFYLQTKQSKPLNDAKALELGANFIGEVSLFLMVGSLVFIEAARSSIKTKNKEKEILKRIENLENLSKSSILDRG